MKLFGGVISVSGMAFLVFSVFAIVAVGYLLGRVTIKGINLGTAGVFIVALLYGAFLGNFLNETVNKEGVDIVKEAFKSLDTLGLILFVAAVGFIAGPNFFKNLKKNFKSYILLGVVIIASSAAVAIACFFIGRGSEANTEEFMAELTGLLSGALTSTPAFSASREAVAKAYQDAVTAGYSISYIFGVIGVVLFVQLIPKIMKVDMDKERALITANNTAKNNGTNEKLITIDSVGLWVFAIAAVVGVLVGAIKIPLTSNGLSGTTFSLTTTGGVLLTTLVCGHFGHIGRISLTVKTSVLETFREFGLMLFLIGAGVPGGMKFVQYFKPVYFVYGVAMTIVPMIVGFIFAKYVLKLPLLNNLGSITGGMTSTPALGTLISVSGTSDVASAYASTYPIALIAVVLASQLLIMFFK